MLNSNLKLSFFISTCMITLIFIFSAPLKFVGTDDSFYYIITALNYIKTGEISFDGVTKTNGFHPLYFYILASGYQFFEITREASMFFGALINSFFYFIGSLTIYLSFRNRISFQTFSIIAMIGYLTPFILAPVAPAIDIVSWIETTEFALSFCSFAIYMAIITKILMIKQPILSTHMLTFACVLIIIQFFVRTDSPVLTIPILFLALILKREFFRCFISTWSLLVIIPFGILVYFYLSSNYQLNGSLVQISGLAKSYHMTLGAEGSFFTFEKRILYYLAKILFGTEENAIAIYKISFTSKMLFGILNFLWICTLCTMLVLSFKAANKFEKTIILLVTVGTFTFFFAHFLRGWIEIKYWYFAPVFYLVLLMVPLFFERKTMVPLFSFFIISLLIFIFQAFGKSDPDISRVINAEAVVSEFCNKPVEDIIIGTPNSGEFSYYGQFSVVNLDGLMNDLDYLNALKNGDAVSVLKNRGVDLIVMLSDYLKNEPYTQFSVLKSFEKNNYKFFPLSDNCKVANNLN